VPREGQKVTIDGKDYAWRRVQSATDTVSFQSGTGDVPPYVVGYAWAEVASPEAGARLLGLGSDDGVKVFLNGREVHANWIGRPVVADADLLPVTLVKGTNRLLLKVQNMTGDWGFTLRLLGGEPLQDLLVQAAGRGERERIETLLAGGAAVDAAGASGLSAFQSAKLHGRKGAQDLLRARGADTARKAPPAPEVLDRTFRRLVKDGYPGAAALAAQDGKVLFRRAYGAACLENHVAATPETRYRIGSVTKQFTAAAALKLQEEGKLSVDDHLSKFLPDFPRGGEVTVHHLLTHTSGIHSYTNKPDFAAVSTMFIEPRELIRSFRDDPYDFDPGRRFLYNNSGYFLLGHIVEKVSGLSYGDYLRKAFFEPLGMKASGVHDAREVIEAEACGYAWEGRVRKAPNWDMSRAGAAGALYSTVDDLQRWNEALFSGRVLSEASFRAATTPALTADDPGPKDEGYGYGLALGKLRGLRTVSHGGGLAGFRSQLLRIPERRFTAVVLVNSAPNVPGLDPDALAQEMAELFLGETLPDRAEPQADATVSPTSYDAYLGSYDYGGAILSVTREGDRLFAQLTGQPRFEIFPKAEGVFFWKVVEAEVTFVRDASGKVTKAVHRQGGQTIDAPRFETPALAKVDPARYDDYAGRYDYGPGRGVMTVTREGDRLFAQLVGQPRFEIFPKGEAEFFWRVVRAEVTFVRDAAGKVTKAVHRQGGGTIDAPRLE
jgi:CubicO group peptidase (beta-lactamase class C family)